MLQKQTQPYIFTTQPQNTRTNSNESLFNRLYINRLLCVHVRCGYGGKCKEYHGRRKRPM